MKTLLALCSLLFFGCSAAADCKKPENAMSTECKVITSVIDCTQGELPAVVAQMAPIVLQLIAEATGADGSVDWSHVDLSSLGKNEGTCILTDMFLKQTTSPPKLAKGMVAPSPASLKQAIEAHRTRTGIAADVKVHTAHGDY